MDYPSRLSTRHALLAILLLIVAMAGVFGQVYGHEFLIYDDDKHVVENPHLNPITWHGVRRLWQQPYWGLYVPASYTFFAAEASIARRRLPDGTPGRDGQATGDRPNPVVFHVGSLALHVACVLLVFVILRRLFRHDGAACAGALLFGLHPVQVESVAWVSETRGLLCGVFSLLAIWQYLCYAGTPQRVKKADGALAGRESRVESREPGGKSRRSTVASPGLWTLHSRLFAAIHYLAATACFALALLCKPAAVAVPVIVGALDWGLLRRPLRRVLPGVVPWLVLAGGWTVLTKSFQPDEQLPFVSPLWARPLLGGDALAFYLIKLLAPLRLGPDYGRSPSWVISQWSFYVAWLLPAAGLIGLASLRHRRLWLTAAAVSLAWLLPVLGLVPFVFQRISTVADRYLYLALLGPALMLCWLLCWHFNRGTIAVVLTALSLWGILSWQQTRHWRNDRTLIAQGLRVNPRSGVARNNLAVLMARKGKHAHAVALYREALADHPTMAELYLGLRASLLALGKPDEALEVMREAVRQVPCEPILHFELANDLETKGERDQAVLHYRKALQLEPHDVQTHVNLGVVLYKLGKADEARYHYRAALEIRPRDPAAHYNLGNLFLAQGALSDAVAHYRSALQADPDYASAHVNLGIALLELDKVHAAIPHLQTALRLVPPDSEKARQIRELLRPYLEEEGPE